MSTLDIKIFIKKTYRLFYKDHAINTVPKRNKAYIVMKKIPYEVIQKGKKVI